MWYLLPPKRKSIMLMYIKSSLKQHSLANCVENIEWRIQIDKCIVVVVDFLLCQGKKEQTLEKTRRKLSEFIIKLKYRDFLRNAMILFCCHLGLNLVFCICLTLSRIIPRIYSTEGRRWNCVLQKRIKTFFFYSRKCVTQTFTIQFRWKESIWYIQVLEFFHIILICWFWFSCMY